MRLTGTGVSGRGTVALKHDAGPPTGKPHQVRLAAAVLEPLVRERVAELVWMEVGDTDLLAASPQHDRLPLAAAVTAANVNDTSMFQAVVDDLPPVRTPSRRRRTRPDAIHADKAYDSRANRSYLRQRGIGPRIARRGIESSSRLGRHRWRVERTPSWLSCYRRLGMRWDRGSERWFAFVLLACALVCLNRL
jgi:Transposase DDE domain